MKTKKDECSYSVSNAIRTLAMVRDWKEIGTVAGIIALRAALTFLIHWEIKEEEK